MTRASPNPRHVPVLVDEVVHALAIAQGESVVDGTFGAGGYARALLAAGAGRVIGFDRDPSAIAAGPSLVPDAVSSGRLTLVEERFSQMDRVLQERGIGPVDAIALDIGVSSMQIDQPERVAVEPTTTQRIIGTAGSAAAAVLIKAALGRLIRPGQHAR